jgi:hypothetical protein
MSPPSLDETSLSSPLSSPSPSSSATTSELAASAAAGRRHTIASALATSDAPRAMASLRM